MFDPLLAIPAGLLFIVAAQLAARFWPGRTIRRPPGLPGYGYTLVYADAPKGEREAGVTYSKKLSDPHHRLQGKPDMVFSNGRQFIPVELKSGSLGIKNRPRDGDLMQLAVYFILVEAEYGVRPKQGRLIYNDGMFIVANSRVLRKRLLRMLAEMRKAASAEPSHAPEAHWAKCLHCPCRGTVCEFMT